MAKGKRKRVEEKEPNHEIKRRFVDFEDKSALKVLEKEKKYLKNLIRYNEDRQQRVLKEIQEDALKAMIKDFKDLQTKMEYLVIKEEHMDDELKKFQCYPFKVKYDGQYRFTGGYKGGKDGADFDPETMEGFYVVGVYGEDAPPQVKAKILNDDILTDMLGESLFSEVKDCYESVHAEYEVCDNSSFAKFSHIVDTELVFIEKLIV